VHPAAKRGLSRPDLSRRRITHALINEHLAAALAHQAGPAGLAYNLKPDP